MTGPLLAVLFRGMRFQPSTAHRATTCYNCKGRLKKGVQTFRGQNSMGIKHLHPACAEAIVDDGNEHIRGESNGEDS